MPESGERTDPYRAYNFKLDLGGDDAIAAFSECSGLTFDVESVEYREGTDIPLHVRKLPGLRKFANLALKRGFTDNKTLWEWYKNILNGIDDRRSGAIVLEDEEHKPVLRWEFNGAWPCKWEGPTMSASANEVAIESLEICVERVELVD